MIDPFVLCWLLFLMGSLFCLFQVESDEGLVVGLCGLAICFSPFIAMFCLVNYITSER